MAISPTVTVTRDSVPQEGFPQRRLFQLQFRKTPRELVVRRVVSGACVAAGLMPCTGQTPAVLVIWLMPGACATTVIRLTSCAFVAANVWVVGLAGNHLEFVFLACHLMVPQRLQAVVGALYLDEVASQGDIAGTPVDGHAQVALYTLQALVDVGRACDEHQRVDLHHTPREHLQQTPV